MKSETCSLDRLPLFSDWPEYLIGLKPLPNIKKTPDELIREYDREKWGDLLNKLLATSSPVTLDAVDALFLPADDEVLCSEDDLLFVMSSLEANRQHIEKVQNTLATLAPFPSLVELGAGYGSVILRLALNGVFEGANFFAGEYTTNGIRLIKEVTSAENLKVAVGKCDFSGVPLTDFELPPNAVIFTSMAVVCVPELPATFMDQLLAAKPKAVVHFEPVVEMLSDRSLLDLLSKRYVQVNDYNTNLMQLLTDYQDRGLIRIEAVERRVFGANPLLSASSIVWRPV